VSPEEAAQEQLNKFEDLMARFQRVFHVRSVVKDFGLTASQVFILRYLDRRAHAKASDIAKVSGLSPGAVTQVCDELVRAHLVERTRSNDDRRVVHIAITDPGRKQLEQIRRLRSEKMLEILKHLGTHDAQEFVRIFSRVVDIVEDDSEISR
jgi:DNA-binding MarR family transcriptional regulator